MRSGEFDRWPTSLRLKTMLAICSRNHSWLVKAALLFFLACGALTSVQAQTADEVIAKLPPSLSPDDAEIQKLVIRGYAAYATKMHRHCFQCSASSRHT